MAERQKRRKEDDEGNEGRKRVRKVRKVTNEAKLATEGHLNNERPDLSSDSIAMLVITNLNVVTVLAAQEWSNHRRHCELN